MPFSRMDVLFDLECQIAEGPLWLESSAQLSFVDVLSGLVHIGGLDGTLRETVDVGQHVGAAMPAAGGGFLLARRDGFVHLDNERTQIPIDLPLEHNPHVRFNDGKCDNLGRAWAGTMAYDKAEGAGDLFRLSASGEAESVVGAVTVSNGLGWSPDEKIMYYIDSQPQHLFRFDYDLDTGTASGMSLLIDFSQWQGAPDGLAVDGEGCLWVATWGGWAVHRFDPKGKEIGVVEIPVSNVSSCCFAGDVLIVTTASSGLDSEERVQQPHAGAVFAVPVDIDTPGAVPWCGLSPK